MSASTEIVAECPNLYKSPRTWQVPGTAPSLHLLSWPWSRPLISDALKLLCNNPLQPWKHSLRAYLKPCCGSA